MSPLAGDITMEVAPDVFAVSAPFLGFPLNLYFIGGKEWAVVDTGISTTPREAIVPFMEDHGGVKALTFVLGTHGHVDHVGGNGALRSLNPEVRLSLPALDILWAESPQRHYLQLYKAAAPGTWDPDDEFEALIVGAFGEPAAIDVSLVDGQTLNVSGRTVEVQHVGAHSPGHVIFVDRASDVAFVGDIIQGAGELNTESGLRSFPLYTPVREYRKALESVRQVGVSTYCTAHTGVLSREEMAVEIDAAVKWTEDFHAFLRDLLERNDAMTLTEVVNEVLMHMPGYERSLQVHVATMAHLDELIRSEDAKPSMRGGLKTWSRNR